MKRFLAAVCFVTAVILPAEEVILNKTFSRADELLAPWIKAGVEYASPQEAKLPGGQGALKFSTAAFSDKLIHIKLPLEQLRGRAIQLEADLRAVNLEEPKPNWLGPKIMLHAVTPRMQIHAEQPKIWGTHDWKHFSVYTQIPRNATLAEVVLGLQKGKGTIYVANVKVIVIPRVKELEKPVFKGKPAAFTTQYRGMMTPVHLTERDIADFAEKFNGNLFRYQMTRGQADLSTEKLYNQWLDEKMAELDRLMPILKKYGIKVVIDVHTGPGMPQDRLLRNIIRWEPEIQDVLVRAWEKLAAHYRGNPVIYGYDLLNEPREDNYVYRENGGLNWNRLAARIALAIRKIDPDTPIIIEPQLWASPGAFDLFEPLDCPNVIYSFHFYQPAAFTYEAKGRYPGKIGSELWDKERIRKAVQPARDFQLRYNVPIFVGEFSCIRWAEGAADYLNDCISIFEEYGWDWTYHAFREYTGWSVEHDGPKKAPQKVETTDRMTVLKNYFSRNRRK